MRSWFYSPFRVEKEELLKAKAYKDIIQLNIRMVIERTFGILKG
jgi:hypothetical protein